MTKYSKIDSLIKTLIGKRGTEMAEAAISLPLVILTAMLLIRVFTFYLEILNTSIAEHMEALERWDDYSGIGMQVYKNKHDVDLIRGGILIFDAKKEISIKAYMLNEDIMVRASDAIK